MNATALDQILADPRIWRGRGGTAAPPALPSGHAALDAALPGGGWPRAALSEILLPADGVGELQLVLPALVRCGSRARRVVLVDPPYVPFPAAWQAAGLDPAALAIVDSAGGDGAWAAEQCLRSGACAAVLLWSQRITPTALKRLQLAAEGGRTPGFVFRDTRCARLASPAALRLRLHARPATLEVLRCRGGLPPARPLPWTPARAGHA